jgi:hypothetical protein
MQFLKGLGIGFVSFFLATVLFLLWPLVMVHFTLLNPHFTITQIERLNLNSLATELAEDNLPTDAQPYLREIGPTITQIQPWIDSSTKSAVNSIYDYLLSETNSLNISIETNSIKPTLVDNFTKAFLANPPADYVKLSATDKASYLKDWQKQITDAIPSPLTIQQSDIPQDVMPNLDLARQIIHAVKLAFWILIGMIFFLIACMVSIWREMKDSLRTLSIIFLIEGVIGTIAYVLTRVIVPGRLPLEDTPSAIQLWIPGFFNSLIFPWGFYSVTLLVLGILMLVGSIVLRRRNSAS